MTPSRTDTAGVIVRPPLLYLGALAAGLGADGLWPLTSLGGWGSRAGGIVLIAAGLSLGFLAARRFRDAGTSVPTSRPSTALVTSGPYARSRNPIYLALTAIYAGIGLALDSPWSLILLIPVLIVMRYGVIDREERYLEARFGDAYRTYLKRVRRWL